MGLTTTRAVILHTYRYSETSKILRLMTYELGPCSALARGALRPKSRFGGLLEPFVEGQAILYMKRGRGLHTLSSFEPIGEYRQWGVSLDSFTIASVLCEMVMRLAPEHRDDDLYRTLIDGLEGLHNSEGPNSNAGLKYVWALVDTLGFRPELDECVVCGKSIGFEGARFDFSAGGLQCMDCAPHGPGMRSAEIRDLRALVGGGSVETHGGQQARWLADFIRYHLTEGANLKSLPFLRDLG